MLSEMSKGNRTLWQSLLFNIQIPLNDSTSFAICTDFIEWLTVMMFSYLCFIDVW